MFIELFDDLIPLRLKKLISLSGGFASKNILLKDKNTIIASTIDPNELIRDHSVEELCATSENYFRRIEDPSYLLTRPFSDLSESPMYLYRLGLLLLGMRIGKSMAVLDFGAGSCWLSKLLNQLQCCTISVDCSITALEIGKKLFEQHPINGAYVKEPVFLHFNGHHIDIVSESIDRIICFDAFHHIPNQKEVLSEFYRVLKPGGIAGFSEPGIHHSLSTSAQEEMRNFNVLENDILLDEIKRIADEIGFTKIYLKLFGTPLLDLNYDDYKSIISNELHRDVVSQIAAQMQANTTFFLVKGSVIPDSRGRLGLMYNMEVERTNYTVKANQQLDLKIDVSNTGIAKWLHENIKDIGVVKIGISLYDEKGTMLERDFFRSKFNEDILPGIEIIKNINPTIRNKGKYQMKIDLVSEHVCWFEDVGSKPGLIYVTVD